ncbi:ATP-binding protein [Paenibacillus kobensis]|uniref:ATP-binding protein n=1 Tax=Paenibacillus kobensis TaxID=59841 RepID=UPI000FD90E2A|nr:ATP-binding protein [Paenibacillus kobensis]
MWQTMILQVFISMLPPLVYQLWHDRPNYDAKRGAWFTGIVCGISMVLCMLMSMHMESGYQFDIRLIPYIIGSLYGGYWSMGALTLLYTSLRIPFFNTDGEWLAFGMFLIIFCPMVLLSIQPFQLARRKDKQKIGAVLITVLQLFYGTTMLIDIILSKPKLMWEHVWILIGLIVLSYLVLWSSILIIENMREKQMLHRQLRRMSEKYRAEVQKLQQFIDETPLGVVLLDSEGRVTHLNEVAHMHFTPSTDKGAVHEMRGCTYLELIDPVRDGQSISMLQKALRGSRTSVELVETEGRVLVKTAFTMRDNEMTGPTSITGAALIMHDITELRHLRDELGRMDRLSLVGQMAASITHEIRNPMAVIRGFVQLMRERANEGQIEYFRIIMEELDRANAIINDFLSLAQNRLIDKAHSSLNDLMSEMLPLIQADANLRGIQVEWHPKPGLPALLLNDKEMKQLILNLARNGLEAMKEGTGVLLLSTDLLPGAVVLRVQDTGIGISKEQMAKLFEPFFTTKSRGTGLGLPVCLSIVERHNGRIDVESEEGNGTTFVVTFRLEEGEAEAAVAAEEYKRIG